jgi:NAD(P)-dependent dehydrogenase (short-subunit alcohol dehydrogenase family)
MESEIGMTILEKFSLKGKAGFVTGGARGIGKSVATAFAEAGADIAIIDIDIDEAEKTAAELAEKTGRNVIAKKCDVTDAVQVADTVSAIVSEYGHIDIAFCNAGICINAPAEEMTYDQWAKVIGINLTGVFLTAQAAGRAMIAQDGGSIIMTASMSGHIVNRPQPQCAYNASKAGVIQLGKSLATEWAQKNVRVNTISPGYIMTELVTANASLTPLFAEWESQTPVARMGKPEELQGICVYLASDASPFTTGADFTIDGAFTAV